MARRALSPQQQRSLIQAIVEAYDRDPSSFRKVLPVVAELLEIATYPGLKRNAGSTSPLTPNERTKREQSLARSPGEMKAQKELPKEQAIRALEDIATLVESHPWDPAPVTKKELACLLRASTGLSLNTRGKRQAVTIQPGEVAREVFLLRGVKLGLTWDRKLVTVEVDPKELANLAKALSIIGIGSDTATDVARNHDEYLGQILDEEWRKWHQ